MPKQKILFYSMMLVGLLSAGLAITLMRLIDWGTDPFTTLNLGLSNRVNLSFGVTQMLSNVVLAIVQFKTNRLSMGLGTVLNLFFLGYYVDFLYGILGNSLLDLSNVFTKIIILVIAVFLITFGVALYTISQKGIAPYDNLSVFLSKKNTTHYRFYRIATDVCCILIGYSVGGAEIGITTVIMAFFCGPLIQNFSKKITNGLIRHNWSISKA